MSISQAHHFSFQFAGGLAEASSVISEEFGSDGFDANNGITAGSPQQQSPLWSVAYKFLDKAAPPPVVAGPGFFLDYCYEADWTLSL